MDEMLKEIIKIRRLLEEHLFKKGMSEAKPMVEETKPKKTVKKKKVKKK